MARAAVAAAALVAALITGSSASGGSASHTGVGGAPAAAADAASAAASTLARAASLRARAQAQREAAVGGIHPPLTHLPPPSPLAYPRLRASPAPAGPTMNVDVLSHGADPSGQADSTAALQAAIDAAAGLARAGTGTGSGDVRVDLAGGTYLVSSPLTLHGSNYSGFSISGGSLVADPAAFPPDAYIFDCIRCSAITWRDLTLDNAHVGGGMRVDAILQSVVDDVFFLHYGSVGLHGDDKAGQGHELLVVNAVFAEFMWGEPGYNVTAAQNGTAIFMSFPDSHFYSIIIRCTRVGGWRAGGRAGP
jgi:hypothetical protein